MWRVLSSSNIMHLRSPHPTSIRVWGTSVKAHLLKPHSEHIWPFSRPLSDFNENYYKETSKGEFEKNNVSSRKLNLYWKLNEDQKRRFANPGYVRQAVKDTFIQRAHGVYTYKKPVPVINQASSNTTGNRKSEQKKAPVDAENASVLNHLQAKRQGKLFGFKKSTSSKKKTNSELQLAAAKNKINGQKPKEVDPYTEKNNLKPSKNQLELRKRKYKADTAPDAFLDRVFPGLRPESQRFRPAITLTPRSIEVDRSQLPEYSLPRPPIDYTDKRVVRKIDKLMRKPTSVKKVRSRTTQDESARQEMIHKMKVSASNVIARRMEEANARRRMKNTELSPQIYPRGSLSMRTSHLPITPCRRVSSSMIETENHVDPPPLATIPQSRETKFYVSNFVNSVKSFFRKFRVRSN